MTVLKKEELKTIIAEMKDITKKDAEAYMDDVFETFESIVTEYGAGFQFGKIGKFDVVDVEEKDHKRRNPQTGEEFMKTTPAHYALKFKVSKPTKEALVELKANES